jgi:hypothetical protein
MNIAKNDGGIVVTFSYSPLLVEKIKTIPSHRWHSDKKYWSFPNTNGTLEMILKVFEGEEVYINPALQVNTIPFVGEGKGEGVFEDLRRELVSRKYSYKTAKVYLNYNKDLLNFTNKKPS